MEPILGQIITVPWNWEMRGYVPCRGQVLSIAQYSALFALLGTKFGGNGTNNFQLPDLRPWNTDGQPDTGKRVKREWHDDELVSHIAIEGIFPSRN